MTPLPQSLSLTHKLTSGPLLSVLSPGQASLTLITTPSGHLKCPHVIANLHQTPIFLNSDPSSTILVIVGVLRRAIILTPDPVSKTVKTKHFLLPGNARLTTTSLSVQSNEPQSITIHDDTSAVTLQIEYKNSEVAITTNPPTPTSSHQEDLSQLFRQLLQAIDRLTDTHQHHATQSQQLDASIASYNAYLANRPKLTATPTVTRTPRSSSTTLHEPPPISGSIVYLNITLSPVPQNWFIRCTTSPLVQPGQHRSTLHDTPRSSLRRVVTLPLSNIVSFPIVLSSHAPLQASFQLIFLSSHIPLSTSTFDILNFSHPTTSNLPDTSHVVLAPVNTLLNPPHVRKRPSNATTTRLQLPIPPKLLQNLPIGNFATVLGGSFTTSLSPGSKPDTSTITIHGAYHVIPFVRAALLRRVLQQDILTPVAMNGAASITKWKRSLADGVNEWLPSFRRAESALVNAKTVYERIDGGEIEMCYDRGEKRVYDDAVLTARATYGMLRRTLERLWSMGDGVT